MSKSRRVMITRRETAPGYHIREIERGVFGEASKVREETEEFLDAVEQGVKVMALVELSDLIGAIQGFLANHHPDLTIHDLIRMKEVTARAFQTGQRS